METTDLVERLLLRAREFERATDFGGKMMDDARNRLEAAQSALQAKVEKQKGYIRRLGENAAQAAKSYAARVEKLEGLAKRALEALDRTTCSIENHSRRDEARRQADEIRDALAEDYCGIVEVNEEDFKADGGRE